MAGILGKVFGRQESGGILGRILDSGMIGDIGAGLLAQSGPSRMPVGLGQAFGNAMMQAQGAQSQRLQNQAMREKMNAERDKREALNKFLNSPGGIAQVEGMQGIPPELIAAYPELVMQRLLSPRSQAPTDLRMMDALGIPRTPEGFAAFSAQKNSGNTSFDALRADMERFRIQEQMDENNAAKAGRGAAYLQGTGAIKRLAKAYDNLDGVITGASSGLPQVESIVNTLRSGSLALNEIIDLGIDKEAAQKIVNARATVDGEANNLILALQGLDQSTGGRTNLQTSIMQSGKPGVGVPMDVNRERTLSALNTIKLFSDTYGDSLGLSDEEYEALSRSLSLGGGDNSHQDPLKAAQKKFLSTFGSERKAKPISKMSSAEIESLDLSKLTDEELDLAEQRAAELLREQ